MTQDTNYKEHRWDEKLIEQFGNARCKDCGMQYEYYKRNIATLTAWTKEEIESEKDHYDKIMKSYKECVSRH